MSEQKCHDCGISEGQIHHYGCDMEECPFCGEQLISCQCAYRMLYIDVREGTWAYENGLTKEQEHQWLEKLEQKGRIPYIVYPVMCGHCGKLWPDFFRVPDEEWKHYTSRRHQRLVICRPCYDEIKGLIDKYLPIGG